MGLADARAWGGSEAKRRWSAVRLVAIWRWGGGTCETHLAVIVNDGVMGMPSCGLAVKLCHAEALAADVVCVNAL